ncbi:MAG TPA: hypothetical protein VMU25_02795 [Candidatus Paceibacterota bacterium]|nr:hypothetical protein [Candidatus Paceibacterota bacterium]
MSKRGFLKINATRGEREEERAGMNYAGFNPPPARPHRMEPIVLFGEKARSLDELFNKARGKYPVYCQSQFPDCPGPIVRVQDEEQLRVMCFRVQLFWLVGGYFVIRKA